MPTVPNVSPGNVRGLVGKLAGVYEEIAGTLVGNERLRKQGQLRQEAGTKRLEALRHGARATKQEAKAKTAEHGQRSAQRSKESA